MHLFLRSAAALAAAACLALAATTLPAGAVEGRTLSADEAAGILGGQLSGYCCGTRRECQPPVLAPCNPQFNKPPSKKICESIIHAVTRTGTPPTDACQASTPGDTCTANVTTPCLTVFRCVWDPNYGCYQPYPPSGPQTPNQETYYGGTCGQGDTPCP